MKIAIFMGSPRKAGNTAALLKPFEEELRGLGHECTTFFLHDRDIHPCMSCRACQRDWTVFGCVWRDGVPEIFDSILESDLLLFATPIYSWYCTPPMKALLDRLVYGMNKYYGEERGPALWAGKKVATMVTCGYRPEQGADLWSEGLRRYCKHSQLHYLGVHAERFLGYQTTFMDQHKDERARAFARKLVSEASSYRE
ncbi:MAG: flavodoxin family protein [Ndongobacter sp.]|nr:flavodoxin family protein [Ndongobacter sp.]